MCTCRKKHNLPLCSLCVCFILKKLLLNWPCSTPMKHVSHLSFTYLRPQVCIRVTYTHTHTYLCHHITLTLSIDFIQLTAIKTTNYTCNNPSKKKNRQCKISNVAELFDSTYEISHLILQLMREMQENYYLILFIFAGQLYFYVLGSSNLLGYQYFNLGSKVIFIIRQLGFPSQLELGFSNPL